MTRYEILFGQNFLDLSFAGLGGTAQLKCDVSIGSAKLDTLVSEHDGTEYVLYDVQDLIPVGDAIALPVFRNGHAVYEGFVKELALKYYNATQSQTVTRKIIAGANVLGFDTIATFGQFLTKQPSVQKTNFRATEWLWFLMNFNEAADTVVLKIELNTKGKQEIVKSNEIAGYLKDKLVCVDVSPELVASQFEVEKQYINSYRVWFENAETRVSEYREYHLANSSAYDVELIVLNSFGVWDSINVIAGQKNSKEFDLQYSENRKKVKLEAASWVNKYSFSITDLEQGWLRYLIELIVSKKIYLRDGADLLPIVCTTKNYDDYYNQKVQDEATLEFRAEAIERSVKI